PVRCPSHMPKSACARFSRNTRSSSAPSRAPNRSGPRPRWRLISRTPVAGSSKGHPVSAVGFRSAVRLLPPLDEFFLQARRGQRIEADDRLSVAHFLEDEVLVNGHLMRFGGDVRNEMRGNYDDAFPVADEHVSGPNRNIAAADRHIDVYCMMQCQ